jgi:hypothetical protein
MAAATSLPALAAHGLRVVQPVPVGLWTDVLAFKLRDCRTGLRARVVLMRVWQVLA